MGRNALTLSLPGMSRNRQRSGSLSQKREAALDSFEQDTANVERFLSLAKKYTDFSELTTLMINEFIEKIIVHAPEKIDGDRTQEVEIYLEVYRAV